MSDLGAPELIPPGVNDARSRAFVRALGDVLGTFRTSALLVQDPLTVDARLLPAMTVELAMTEFVWPGLREVHLRNLLAAAPEIHALTGTVAGARSALAAIGVTVDWTQWYQADPKLYHDTHIVVAYINDHLIEGQPALLTAETQQAVLRLIEATQRWSQDITFKLGVGFRSAAAPVGILQSVEAVKPTMTAAIQMPAASFAAHALSESVAALRCNVAAEIAMPRARGGAAGALSSIQFVHARMEAIA